jgi:O-antigen/teichoic acid export membrane protein
LFFQAMRRLVIVGVPVLIVVAMASPLLRDFFRLEGPGPVLAATLVCIAMLLLTALAGILQGLQKFGWYGAQTLLWFAGRLVFAVLLCWLGFRATGALSGMVLGSLMAGLIPYLALRKSVFNRLSRERIASREIYRYAAKVFLVYACFMFMGNVDVMTAKHYFEPEQAGLFAQACLLAHMLWLVPWPVIMAMFPGVAKCRAEGRDPGVLMKKGMLLGGGFALIFALGVRLLPSLAFGVLFKQPEHPMIALMPGFLVAMFPLALCFVVLNYEMASNRFTVLIPMLAVAVGTAVALVLRHGSFEEIVFIVGCANWILTGAVILVHLVEEKRSKSSTRGLDG